MGIQVEKYVGTAFKIDKPFILLVFAAELSIKPEIR